MKHILLLLLLVNLVFGLTNKEKEYIEERMETFELEWDRLLGQEYKNAIIKNFYKGRFFDLEWTAAAVTFIESRGVKNRANANVVNNDLSSLDCGIMGSNTYYYLKYKGVEKPTLYQQVDACYELNHNPYKSFLHFLNVMTDAMESRDIKKLKGSGRYWHYVWNYYNTGSTTTLKGTYYLDIVAAIKVLKKKIDIVNDISYIGFTSNDMRYIAPVLAKWKLKE